MAREWEEKLQRGTKQGKNSTTIKKFSVSLSTKVCSNHFAAGYCSDHCRIPTLYLRGYNTDENCTDRVKGKRKTLLGMNSLTIHSSKRRKQIQHDNQQNTTELISIHPASNESFQHHDTWVLFQDHTYCLRSKNDESVPTIVLEPFELLQKRQKEKLHFMKQLNLTERKIKHLKEENSKLLADYDNMKKCQFSVEDIRDNG